MDLCNIIYKYCDCEPGTKLDLRAGSDDLRHLRSNGITLQVLADTHDEAFDKFVGEPDSRKVYDLGSLVGELDSFSKQTVGNDPVKIRQQLKLKHTYIESGYGADHNLLLAQSEIEQGNTRVVPSGMQYRSFEEYARLHNFALKENLGCVAFSLAVLGIYGAIAYAFIRLFFG
jgi:hypothetical protein